MADLISRAAALNALLMSKNYRDARDSLEQLPAVDAVPVEWLHEKMLYGEPDESKTAWRTLKMWEREQEAR